MQIQLYRHLWGISEPWATVFPRIRNLGYAGIETSVPHGDEQQRFAELLRECSLSFIAQVYTDGSTVKEHVKSLRKGIMTALPLNPVLINCHGGSDAFSETDSVLFFEQALRLCDEVDVPVAFETHRSRILYNPWIAHRLVTHFPDLHLCADYSHWVCVCERLLDDAREVFLACAERTLHIHARVGYEQGPQVSDPRAPEFAAHVARHEEWWRMIWRAQWQRGILQSTLAPEFGPPNYLQTQPYSRIPLADLEEICEWQADRQRKQFALFLSEAEQHGNG